MEGAPLAYAFGVGMVATFNPCGFAMLPAYLSYFLGLEGELESGHLGSDEPRQAGAAGAGMLRALVVGASMSAGFLVVFAVMGTVIETATRGIMEYLPWLTIVLGVGLVVMGVLMLRGRTVSVSLPFIRARTGTGREAGSIFVFGMSYAFVSLSCTISLFLATVSTTFTQASFIAGVATFVAYGAGMSLVLVTLTIAMALARTTLVHNLKRVVPYVHRIAAVALIVAGFYVAYYGVYELRVYAGDTSGGEPARVVFDLNSRVSSWVQQTGPTRIGLILAGAIGAAVTLAIGLRAARGGRSGPAP